MGKAHVLRAAHDAVPWPSVRLQQRGIVALVVARHLPRDPAALRLLVERHDIAVQYDYHPAAARGQAAGRRRNNTRMSAHAPGTGPIICSVSCPRGGQPALPDKMKAVEHGGQQPKCGVGPCRRRHHHARKVQANALLHHPEVTLIIKEFSKCRCRVKQNLYIYHIRPPFVKLISQS